MDKEEIVERLVEAVGYLQEVIGQLDGSFEKKHEESLKLLEETVFWRKDYIDRFGTIINKDRHERIRNIFCGKTYGFLDPKKELIEVVKMFRTSDREEVDYFIAQLEKFDSNQF